MAQKPSIPKGTRDFNPEEVAKRNYIFDIIRSQFELYGFQPIETPSFENSDTLMGKYGEEGDRLIFKILDSGDFFSKVSTEIERTYYIVNSLKNTFNTLLKHIIKSDSFNNEYIILKNISGNEKLYKDLEKKFKYNLRRNLLLMNEEFKVKGYINNIIENLDLDDLLKTKFLDWVNSHSYDTKKKLLLNKGNKNSDRLYDFSTEIVETVLSKKLNLLLPETRTVTSKFSEKALRYDLTVPFARYVVQHQNEIEFPFKRYQIQPVWRADRPQKGRFREFYQCDADVVGSQSLWQEVEFVQLYDAVFSALKLEGVTIKINNRKILSGIAEVIGAQDKLIDFTVALDKLDKIGEEKVKEEMLSKGIPQSGIDKLQPLFNLSGTFESQISQLKSILSSSEQGTKGIEELEFIDKAISELGLKTSTLQLDVTLARGLNYYTGAILEVSAPKGVDMGSIGGGGRYDDLTGIFGLKDMSGVGISFGLDRIYLVLEALNLFPETISTSVKALFLNYGEKEAFACLKAIKELRTHGIKSELYPDASTNKKQFIKQMNYANKRNIPNIVLLGESELESGTFALKNMESGEQQSLTLKQLINTLK